MLNEPIIHANEIAVETQGYFRLLPTAKTSVGICFDFHRPLIGPAPNERMAAPCDERGKLLGYNCVLFNNIIRLAEYADIHSGILPYSFVRISGPFFVMSTVCSKCAVREPSFVRYE